MPQLGNFAFLFNYLFPTVMWRDNSHMRQSGHISLPNLCLLVFRGISASYWDTVVSRITTPRLEYLATHVFRSTSRGELQVQQYRDLVPGRGS